MDRAFRHCQKAVYLFLLLLIINILSPPSAYAYTINVNLTSPLTNTIYNNTNNVTLICNASSDTYIKNITLYHDIAGTFVANQTTHFGELKPDYSTVLAMHFNNDSSVNENDSFIYDWSGNGNNGYVQGSDYTPDGKFLGAFEFNNANNDFIEINDSEELNLANGGTVEFWLKPTSSSKWRTVVSKGTGIDWESSPYVFTLESGSNEICMYLSNEYGTITNICSQFGLSLGTWYHIAGTWNSSSADLFIDGVLNETYEWEYGDFPLMESPYPVTIGKTDTELTTWYAYYNGSIDELFMYNRALSASEIQEHYQMEMVNNTTKTTSFYNILDGSYKWNCFSETYNTLSVWSSSNYTFHIDTYTSPVVNKITLSPSSADDIDPGITINVTANITDVSNVSMAIFQWKEVGDWDNMTMTYNSTTLLYNASFDIDSTGGTYYYRIWSNDTNGNGAFSPTQNVTAEWDYTWIISPVNFGTTSGYVNTVGEIGILTINNTGDDTLNITLTDNWPLPVRYNDSETAAYYPSAKEVITVNITAKFADSDSENDVTITATAKHSTQTPSPISATSNFTLISYTGGPYFYVTIVEYPIETTQNLTTVTLRAKVKNSGNETATNTWLNWTLPTGWYNVSGNMIQYLGDVASGATVWNNITVKILSSSASAGVKTIYVNASCAENKNASDSKIVQVNCNSTDGMCGADCNYQIDSDCSAPPSTVIISGGVGGAVASVAATPEKSEGETTVLKTKSWIEAVRNRTILFDVEVKNIYTNAILSNFTLAVGGFPQQYISVSPNRVLELSLNKSAYFTVTIDVPFYMEQTDYMLDIMVGGHITIANLTTASFSESKNVRMLIREMSEEEAAEMLTIAKEHTDFMTSQKIPTEKALLLLKDMESAINEKDYGLAKRLLTTIEEMKDRGMEVVKLFSDVENRLETSENLGLVALETKRLYYTAKFAFSRSDFFKAGDILKDAQLVHVLETKGKINYVNYLIRNWFSIISSMLLLSVVGVLANDQINLMLVGRRLNSLNREETSVVESMKDVQKEFLEEGGLDSTEYHRKMYEYEKQLEKLKDRATHLLTRGGKVIKPNTIKNLNSEIERLNSTMKDLQREYFDDGVIDKFVYDIRVRSLIERLLEVEKRMAMEQSKRDKRRQNAEYGKKETGKKQTFEKQTADLAMVTNFKSIMIIVAAMALFLVTITMIAQAQTNGIPITKSAAANATELAKLAIEEMKNAGFGTVRADDILLEALEAFERGDYANVLEKTRQITDLKEKAYELDDSINTLDLMIKEAESGGLDVADANVQLSLSRAAFNNERFDEAEEFLNRGYQILQESEAEAIRVQALINTLPKTIIETMRNNWLALSIAVPTVATSFFVAYKYFSKRSLNEKIKELMLESDIIKEKMKILQEQFFRELTITKEEYGIKMEKYNRMLGENKKNLTLLGAWAGS